MQSERESKNRSFLVDDGGDFVGIRCGCVAREENRFVRKELRDEKIVHAVVHESNPTAGAEQLIRCFFLCRLGMLPRVEISVEKMIGQKQGVVIDDNLQCRSRERAMQAVRKIERIHRQTSQSTQNSKNAKRTSSSS